MRVNPRFFMEEQANANVSKQYRQGDVLLRAVSENEIQGRLLPGDGSLILARGEATGHHHAIPAQYAVAMLQSDEGRRFLRVREPAEVRHPEHAPIVLPPGGYEVIRQREHLPFMMTNESYVAD